jgi:hypothetical protein
MADFRVACWHPPQRDFTKTGKRTKRGMLADGYNSAKRYVINNFEVGSSSNE